MESLFQDLKFAVRSLSKRPSFAIMVIATLALGIGAATAIFSLVDGILLRPLPYADPDRLVYANETDGGRRMTFAWPNYIDLRERARSYEGIACHQGNDFSVLSDGRPRRLPGRLVCAPFFDVLGVRMQAGRSFTQALGEQIVPPNWELDYNETFVGRLPAGTYRVRGLVTSLGDTLEAFAQVVVR